MLYSDTQPTGTRHGMAHPAAQPPAAGHQLTPQATLAQLAGAAQLGGGTQLIQP